MGNKCRAGPTIKTNLERLNMKWKLKNEAPQELISEHSDLDSVLVQLLYNRELEKRDKIDAFLEADYEKHTHDPLLMGGMDALVQRLKKAKKDGEKLAVYGDFDADGVCASTILIKALRELGFETEIYIPDREQEGYGLNKKGIDFLKNKGVDLIISVDCGISDIEPVAYAQNKGVDVIVTDHHLVPDKTPDTEIIVNPHQNDCPYPFEYLSGAGIAFKVVQALVKEFDQLYFSGYEKWFLDLVAVATVADLMPLVDENRVLVKYGLTVLPQTKWPGLKKILAKAGKEDLDEEDFSAQTLGFIIGPRLNAAGRMDHANLSFELLTTTDENRAELLADKLEKNNRKRRRKQKKIEKKLKERLEEKENLEPIFEGEEDWPEGVVGLAAGRVSDHFYFPACVFNKGEELCKGSCRSIKGVNIVEILEECSDHLESYGGHEQAAGFKVKTDNLEELEHCFRKKIKSALEGKKLEPELELELEIPTEKLGTDLEQILTGLAPFGKGNPEPKFLVRNLEVSRKRKVGSNNNHLKLTLRDASGEVRGNFNGMIFSWEGKKENAQADTIEEGEAYDFAFEPMFDRWQGRKQFTLNIKDFRRTDSSSN